MRLPKRRVRDADRQTQRPRRMYPRLEILRRPTAVAVAGPLLLATVVFCFLPPLLPRTQPLQSAPGCYSISFSRGSVASCGLGVE